MKLLKKFFLFSCVISFFNAQADTDILFLLDVSGSMKEAIQGEPKIDAARNALLNAVVQIPDDANVGLRMYGHRVELKNKEESCKDSQLVVPVAKLDKVKIESSVDNLKPLGYTPISFSLQQAKNDFPAAHEAERVIILLSDGEETCGGNPQKTIEDLINQGFKVKVHTIGFDVGNKAEMELRSIAQVSGGKYFSAKNSIELSKALTEATKESLIVEKKKTIYGNAVKGGDNFETAVLIQPNTEYRLNHHQMPDQYDYFYFEATEADRITVIAKTLEKGLSIKTDNKIVETDYPHSALSLNDSDRARITEITAFGKFGKETRDVVLKNTGKYYVLFGGNSPIHSEGGTFEIKKEAFGDGNTENDAGSDYSTALEIKPGRYDNNTFTSDKDTDVYKFTAKTGSTFLAALTLPPQKSHNMNIKVVNEFGEEVVKAAQYGSGLKTERFTIKEDGEYFLYVGTCCYSDPVRYSLILKQFETEEVKSDKAE